MRTIKLFAAVCLCLPLFSFSSGAAAADSAKPEFYIEGVSLTQTTIYDSHGVRITAERLDTVEDIISTDVGVMFRVENHSPNDIFINTSCDAYVNDWKIGCAGTFYTVPKGKSQTLSLISLLPNSLARNGIQYIRSAESEILLGSRGAGSEHDWSEMVPIRVETSTGRGGESVVPLERRTIHEDGGIRISAVTEELINQNVGKIFLITVENRTQQYLEVNAVLNSIDGSEAAAQTGRDGRERLYLYPGKAGTLMIFLQKGRQETSPVYKLDFDLSYNLYSSKSEKDLTSSVELGSFQASY